MNFPFNQNEKTKECGWRCVYAVLSLKESYEQWLDNFRFFAPLKNGISFNDICQILDYYNLKYKFTQLKKNGTYIIYSGIWLKSNGHYFIYKDGVIYCSVNNAPYEMNVDDVVSKLEGKTTEQSFRCLEIEI